MKVQLRKLNDGKCKHQSQEMKIDIREGISNANFTVMIESYGYDDEEAFENICLIVGKLKNKLDEISCKKKENYIDCNYNQYNSLDFGGSEENYEPK